MGKNKILNPKCQLFDFLPMQAIFQTKRLQLVVHIQYNDFSLIKNDLEHALISVYAE